MAREVAPSSCRAALACRSHCHAVLFSIIVNPRWGGCAIIRNARLFIILVIFFSLTEAPLPDLTPTPPNTPKRTRNGPKTDPKRSQTEPNGAETEPNGAEMDRNQAFRGGTGGGFVGVGWVGGCKEKRISLHNSVCSQFLEGLFAILAECLQFRLRSF